MSKVPAFTVGAALFILGLAGCGGSSSSSTASSSASSTAPTTTPATTSTASSPSGAAPQGALKIGADPSGQLKFTASSLTAKAGKVAIHFTNTASLAHNLTIEQGKNGPMVGATPTFTGGTKTLTVKLKPGTYTYFCSIPGHRAGGMEGTLTVQ